MSIGGLLAQASGIMSNAPVYDFSVKDCFKKAKFSGSFKADSLPANRILKGVTVWRAINLDNKENGEVFNSSNDCAEVGLFEIIKFGLLDKKLNGFSSDNFNDVRRSHLDTGRVKRLLYLCDTAEVMSFDASGNSTSEKVITGRYLVSRDIKGYLIKENWVMNSNTGETHKYIIGLAPLVYNKEQDKTLPLFWLYYAEWKSLLDAFAARNYYSYDNISYKEVFEKRYFISAISKESNVFDRGLKTYSHGQDASLESEQVKEKLNHAEHDLFQD